MAGCDGKGLSVRPNICLRCGLPFEKFTDHTTVCDCKETRFP